MIKYTDVMVTMTEVPTEISLSINISGCPCHCRECFEPWLADDIGQPLTAEALLELIRVKGSHCTCVTFLGGDDRYDELAFLCSRVKEEYPSMKLCFYSGRSQLALELLSLLDYYKIGPYIPERGPLNNKNTNQIFLVKDENGIFINKTAELFQKEKE